jgi:predicted alpha/beta-hydrolase family hydrolase
MLVDEADEARATLLLAHGAGAPMDSPFLNAIAAGLRARRIRVVRFEFPYMDERRRRGTRGPPNRMPVLEASFVARIADEPRKLPLFIGGKSMGGRVATMIADMVDVRGVLVFGYPFHPPKRPDKLRVQHLSVLRARCLIVQGTRDALGSRDEVAGYALSRRVQLHWLEDGDHSFAPRRSSGRTSAENMLEAVEAATKFMLARTRAK